MANSDYINGIIKDGYVFVREYTDFNRDDFFSAAISKTVHVYRNNEGNEKHIIISSHNKTGF